jgi:outer membrane protein insertion porin family
VSARSTSAGTSFSTRAPAAGRRGRRRHGIRPVETRQGCRALDDFYGKDGYLDTRIRLNRKPNVATGAIDVEYVVNEGEKFNVESIVIEGNTKTKSTVILRELVLGPGDVFSTVLMKISQLRLENTRFFESVNVNHQETNIPGRRNMRIAVHEGRTGNLTFGAGFPRWSGPRCLPRSRRRISIFSTAAPSSRATDRNSACACNSVRCRVKSVLSFEEPWLFQRQLGLGFSVFRTSSEYNSTFYSQIQTGFEVYLRKRLFELVERAAVLHVRDFRH